MQTGDAIGGTELNVFQFISRMDRRRFDIHVCFLWDEGQVGEMYREIGIPVTHIGRRHGLAAIRLLNLLRRNHYDIVDIYGLRLSLIGRLLGQFTNNRNLISSWRNLPEFHKSWQLYLDRITSSWINLYLCNSRAAADNLNKIVKIPLDKLHVIQNGINSIRFETAERGKFRAERRLDDNNIVILCVATLKTVKGHAILLEAISNMRHDIPGVELWLIGDGPLRNHLEHKVNALNLKKHVVFWGFRNDIPLLMADSDIFVLASYTESLSNAIMEAMASSLPVVSTMVGGTPELIENGKNGLLVDAGDPNQLAEALKQLCLSGSLRKRMGENGRRRIKSEFKLSEKVHELENVYIEFAR